MVRKIGNVFTQRGGEINLVVLLVDEDFANLLGHGVRKPAADGALVTAMEGLIRGDAAPDTDIGPLLVEQRRVADEFRMVEMSIQELHNLLAARDVDPADRTEMETGVISRTAELMRLGKRMLELDAAVTVASLRAS